MDEVRLAGKTASRAAASRSGSASRSQLQARRADHPARVEGEPDQQRAQPYAADGHRRSVRQHLQRAQHPDAHAIHSATDTPVDFGVIG
ncbi:hypothetical protein [Plantactinospora soyae]|uniref:Uncharacterized protein n=1 Tax=Plantactinospora soyae TaxID=1544732 RepID=A0A927QXB8_9ACTN|nr:hypothetical protein [Plantactinospora soyae]MBE1487890.1 hypothetical protein [Plantactinospora soyae]